MSIDELTDAYQQFEERAMPKTVTVEVELPDGTEAPNPPPLPIKAILINGGTIEVRPIPAEKTWERPEWLHYRVQYITHDYVNRWRGWERKPEGFSEDYWQGTDFHRMNAINPLLLPNFESSEPAERIWRIVERGEG